MPARRLPPALALAALIALGVGLYTLLQFRDTDNLPPGLAVGNGRLEATELDIASKITARVVLIPPSEGSDVAAGALLARLEAQELSAELRAGHANLAQAHSALESARADQRKNATALTLAQRDYQRSQGLRDRGFVSSEKLDRDKTALTRAQLELTRADAEISRAQAGLAAAQARLDALSATAAETTLTAPRSARVLYKLVQPGEVVRPGDKLLTLLDLSEVFMSIFLPASQAGRVMMNDDARIVLDALPDTPLPAKVVMVSPRAQFTPKEVETRLEREKLMFRVKVQVAPEWVARHAALAKPGMPGVAYVRLDPDAPWPDYLSPK